MPNNNSNEGTAVKPEENKDANTTVNTDGTAVNPDGTAEQIKRMTVNVTTLPDGVKVSQDNPEQGGGKRRSKKNKKSKAKKSKTAKKNKGTKRSKKSKGGRKSKKH